MSAVQQATTLCDALTETVATYPDAPALRSADGATEWTWAQYWARIQDAAAGLAGIGVGRGDTVALWLSNRPEFHVADTAAMQLGSPAFSTYSTFTVEQAEGRPHGAEVTSACLVSSGRAQTVGDDPGDVFDVGVEVLAGRREPSE